MSLGCPQEKNICKNDPIQKFTSPWIVILCVVSWMIYDCLSWQFNCMLIFCKVLQVLHILRFSSIFCIFEPFPTVTVWFGSSFHTEGNWGNTTIIKGENIHWCSRRKHHAPPALLIEDFTINNLRIWWPILITIGKRQQLNKMYNIYFL